MGGYPTDRDLYTSVSLTAGEPATLNVLKEFAEFWKVPYGIGSRLEGEQVLVSAGISHHLTGSQEHPTIMIPSGSEDCRAICRNYNLQLVEEEEAIRLPIAPETFTKLKAIVRRFIGPDLTPLLTSDGLPILSRIQGTQSYVLSIDIIREYSRLIQTGFEDPASTKFRIVSSLPLPYSVVPQSIRNWSLRRAYSQTTQDEGRIGSVDSLRIIFLASIVLASKGRIPRISFRRQGKKYAMSVTHDVETKHGLEEGSRYILEVERRLGLRSTWNLPSDRYLISQESLLLLTAAGDVGAHDTRHDGRLVLASPEEMLERVSSCKEKLAANGKTSVLGFRSPLLQHSNQLLVAIRKAGYVYDSSVPSYEPLSPTSFRPHGIGTVFPMELDGLVEVPVSLPQDHQLVKIQGLTPRAAVGRLLEVSKWVARIGGVCVILVHPDYEFGTPEYQPEYEKLLSEFRNDPECDIMTLKEIAHWWRKRSSAHVEISDGLPRISSDGDGSEVEDLQLEALIGYDKNGFKTQLIDEGTKHLSAGQRNAVRIE